MSDTASYVAYAAAYDNADDAAADFATLKEAGLRHITAALVVKDPNGRVHVHEKTYAGKVAGGVGVIGGAIVGAIFPPAGAAIIADAVVGGAVLGTIGHFAGGLSRKELKGLGDLLDDGEAAVIAVAEDAVATDVDRTLGKAAKKASAKIDDGDVAAAMAELEKGVDKAADKAAGDLA
ncbi:MAG: hypothetical protein U0R64_00030 [Candidatus Nanopelagicales bacterium]